MSMGDHYYTAQPTVKSNQKKWETKIKDKTFQFYSDAGVFSKGRVDFGSRLLIESVDPSTYPTGDWLDMGCGYGPMGISLAAFNPEVQVHMVDINERATSLAKQNAALNQVENVTIYPSNLYDQVEQKEFAAIFSNPPIRAGKKVVHEILEKAYEYLKEEGYLTIVIQKKQGAPSSQSKMEEVFGNVTRIGLDKGYWILTSQKQ